MPREVRLAAGDSARLLARQVRQSDGTTWYLIDPFFFDGFELARALTGVENKAAPTFANRAAMSRFFKTAIAQGPKLLQGELGPVVRALVDDVLQRDPRPEPEKFTAAAPP